MPWSKGRGIFAPADFARLAGRLACVVSRGTFILSINDTPPVPESFAGFAMVEVDTTSTMAGKAQRAGELIISNFELA